MEDANDMEAPPLLHHDSADWADVPRRIALFVEPSPFAFVLFSTFLSTFPFIL